MMMKTCIKCDESKDLDLFPRYKNRRKEWSYTNVCKVCTKLYYKDKHYEANKDDYLERSRKQKEENREGYLEYMRNYYAENKEELREKSKEYRSSNREKSNERYKKYSATEEGTIKNKARKKIKTALRNGSMVRPNVCESCGKELFVEAHHEDYSKPLDVNWLCKSCHWEHHKL
jgi:translation elongation factor EF-G